MFPTRSLLAAGANPVRPPVVMRSACQPSQGFLSRVSPASRTLLCGAAPLQSQRRFQHTTAAPSGSSGESTSGASASPTSAGPGPSSTMHIDPRRLPSTIPGISQEELAARITQYHTERSRVAGELSTQAVAHEIELMRRSLSPTAFAEYMARVEVEQRSAAKEAAKMAAMSPLELHQYQQKKRRQATRYEWYKTFVIVFALVGSTAFLFSLFIFFE